MHRFSPHVVLLAAALAAPLWVPDVAASGLRISPTRLDFARNRPASQVELSNLTAVPVAVQVKAYAWRQENGEDVYEPTKDLFFAPPIVTVPPGERIAVRFRLRGKPPVQAEATYRVYFQELPPVNESSPTGSGMSFRIRFGVPAFVTPDVPVAPRLVAAARRSDTAVDVDLENTGRAHLRVLGVDIFPAGVDRNDPGAALASVSQSEKGGGYILAGSKTRWLVDLPQSLPSGDLLVRVRTNEFSGRAGSGILKNGWFWKPLASGASDSPVSP